MFNNLSRYCFTLCLIATSAFAGNSEYNRFESFTDFYKGEFDGIQLSSDGRLSLSRGMEKGVEPDDIEIIWDVIPFGKEWILATGHTGKLLKTDFTSTATEIGKFKDPEISDLQPLSDSEFLAALAPSGKIMKVTVGKDDAVTSSVFYEGKEKYIWQILPDGKNGFYLGTGQKGLVIHIDKKGKETSRTELNVENVMQILAGDKGSIIAVTQGKGRVYKIEKSGDAYLLYESSEDEIRCAAIDADGNIYAAVNSDRFVKGPLMQLVRKVMATAGAKSGTPPKITGQVAPPRGKSHIVKITPEGFAKRLWVASDAPIYDLVLDAASGDLLLTAGQNGRIFQIQADGKKANVINTVREESISRLIPQKDKIVLATVKPCALYNLNSSSAKEGTFESPVVNAKTIVKWGELSWDNLNDESVEFETRSGNSANPSDSWSPWVKTNGSISSPNAQYLQWRLSMKPGKKNTSAEIDRVETFFSAPNQAPVIAKLSIVKTAPKGTPTIRKPSTTSISKTTTAYAKANSKLKVKDFSNTNKYKVKFLAADPNSDRLKSKIEIKAEDESRWQLLVEDHPKMDVDIDGNAIGDGIYRVKVTVDDHSSNNNGSGQTAEVVSDAFTIDGSGPEIKDIKSEIKNVDGGKVGVISFTAEDASSIIVSASYSLNLETSAPVSSSDGVFDSVEEKFEFEIHELEIGQQVLRILVTDREGNSTVKRYVLDIR